MHDRDAQTPNGRRVTSSSRRSVRATPSDIRLESPAETPFRSVGSRRSRGERNRLQEERVQVPGLGLMSRSSLLHLDHVLSGHQDVSTSGLPDLSRMTGQQLERLEDFLTEYRISQELATPLGTSWSHLEDSRASTPYNVMSATSSSVGTDSQSVLGDSRPSSGARASSRQFGVGLRALRTREPSTGRLDSRTPDELVARFQMRELQRYFGSLVGDSDSESEYAASTSDWADLDLPDLPQEREPPKSAAWKLKESAWKQILAAGTSAPAEECAICCQDIETAAQGDMAPAALPCCKRLCPAYFHAGCIRPWLEKNPTCPLCRADFKELVTAVLQRQVGQSSGLVSGGAAVILGLMGGHRDRAGPVFAVLDPMRAMSIRQARAAAAVPSGLPPPSASRAGLMLAAEQSWQARTPPRSASLPGLRPDRRPSGVQRPLFGASYLPS